VLDRGPYAPLTWRDYGWHFGKTRLQPWRGVRNAACALVRAPGRRTLALLRARAAPAPWPTGSGLVGRQGRTRGLAMQFWAEIRRAAAGLRERHHRLRSPAGGHRLCNGANSLASTGHRGRWPELAWRKRCCCQQRRASFPNPGSERIAPVQLAGRRAVSQSWRLTLALQQPESNIAELPDASRRARRASTRAFGPISTPRKCPIGCWGAAQQEASPGRCRCSR